MSQCRPRPKRQQGYGLLAFVLVTAALGMSIIMGYTGIWTKEKQLNSQATKDRYVQRAAESLEAVYPSLSLRLDSTLGDPISGEEIIAFAQVPIQWELKVVKSKVLTTPEGHPYRAFAFYLNIPEDGVAAPNLVDFTNTGIMKCGVADECDPSWHMTVWNSAELARAMKRETENRLARVVKKAQQYFKARELQDPERNVSINYFRMPSGVCMVPDSLDLGCMDDYTVLATIDGTGGMTGTATTVVPSDIAIKLGLSPDEMLTAWNLPMEVSNLRDAVVDKPPYTLEFRAVLPGTTTHIRKTAVQQF